MDNPLDQVDFFLGVPLILEDSLDRVDPLLEDLLGLEDTLNQNTYILSVRS